MYYTVYDYKAKYIDPENWIFVSN